MDGPGRPATPSLRASWLPHWLPLSSELTGGSGRKTLSARQSRPAAATQERQPSQRRRCNPRHGDHNRGTVPHWKRRQQQLLTDCAITTPQAWTDYVTQVHTARRTAGQPLTRWSAAHLLTALDLAVRGRGWPPDHATRALLYVAADPATRSPARLAEAGPWWDEPKPPTPVQTTADADVAALEAELDSVDGMRLPQQKRARQQLTAERAPLTRLSVTQRAVELLHTSP